MFAFPEVFNIKNTSGGNVFEVMINFEIFKAVGIEKVPGKFLRNGGEVISKPISGIFNL